MGRKKFSNSGRLKDGIVIESFPEYLVVINEGPEELIASDHSMKQKKVSEETIVGGENLNDEFERRKSLYLEKLRREVGCELKSAT